MTTVGLPGRGTVETITPGFDLRRAAFPDEMEFYAALTDYIAGSGF